MPLCICALLPGHSVFKSEMSLDAVVSLWLFLDASLTSRFIFALEFMLLQNNPRKCVGIVAGLSATPPCTTHVRDEE